MLESARKLLEIFAARLENCLEYMLLGSARLEFFKKMNCSKMLGSDFIFPARRALNYTVISSKIEISINFPLFCNL